MENIKKAAIDFCPKTKDSFFHYSDDDIYKEGFYFGAVSDAAKYYWKSIFEKEKSETEKPIDKYIKDHWDGKPLYSEQEVIELLEAFKVTMEFAKKFGLPCDIMELFEINKNLNTPYGFKREI